MLLWFAEMGQRQERVGDKDSCGEGKDKHFKVMDTIAMGSNLL